MKSVASKLTRRRAGSRSGEMVVAPPPGFVPMSIMRVGVGGLTKEIG